MRHIFDVEPMSLSELGAVLASEAMPETCLSLPELDGLLTAVLVSPDLIPPSGWLPAIWGEEEPVFESDEELKRVLGSIMERYNEIARILVDDPGSLRPLYRAGPDSGEPSAELWAKGFIEGMRLSPDSWTPLVNDDEARFLLAPILVFAPPLDGEPAVSAPDEGAERELREGAAEIIPPCVAGMKDFFRSIRPHYAGRTKLGRNDPCFCGSGRKFKKCCGAGRL
jgi:uncharacterized protein